MVDPRIMTDDATMYQKFETELKQDGFVEYRCRKGSVPVFLKSDIPPSHRLIPVRHDLSPFLG